METPLTERILCLAKQTAETRGPHRHPLTPCLEKRIRWSPESHLKWTSFGPNPGGNPDPRVPTAIPILPAGSLRLLLTSRTVEAAKMALCVRVNSSAITAAFFTVPTCCSFRRTLKRALSKDAEGGENGWNGERPAATGGTTDSSAAASPISADSCTASAFPTMSAHSAELDAPESVYNELHKIILPTPIQNRNRGILQKTLHREQHHYITTSRRAPHLRT
ncbi:uncharacterized protein [Paramormyrops kingsleyae]|uniref:uncharacterized protein n=1 Tax=Paramormyrops kingsleyae TaxID=1676925 RepID=UPI003B9728D7